MQCSTASANAQCKQEVYRKLCQDSLAVPGLQAGKVGMICGGEADAGNVNEAAAVIRHGSHVLQQTEGVHTVCCGHQRLQKWQLNVIFMVNFLSCIPISIALLLLGTPCPLRAI